jgi:hypothetical protein
MLHERRGIREQTDSRLGKVTASQMARALELRQFHSELDGLLPMAVAQLGAKLEGMKGA